MASGPYKLELIKANRRPTDAEWLKNIQYTNAAKRIAPLLTIIFDDIDEAKAILERQAQEARRNLSP